MSYTELTVWTRGIIMDKEGRDIVNSIGASARNEGKFSQAMENYVDNPDRTNAPTRKYCRVSDTVIENALTYENEHPNIVVLVEGTMVKGWDYMRGMPPGEGAGETATSACVRARPFNTPRRMRLQFEHPQFHCGKPPPAAEPRTLTRIQN